MLFVGNDHFIENICKIASATAIYSTSAYAKSCRNLITVPYTGNYYSFYDI